MDKEYDKLNRLRTQVLTMRDRCSELTYRVRRKSASRMLNDLWRLHAEQAAELAYGSAANASRGGTSDMPDAVTGDLPATASAILDAAGGDEARLVRAVAIAEERVLSAYESAKNEAGPNPVLRGLLERHATALRTAISRLGAVTANT